MPGRKDLGEALSKLASNMSEGGAGEYEFWKAPDVLEDIRVGSLRLDQVLGWGEIEGLRGLLSGLIGLFIVRHFGDEHAKWQLDIIEKFTFPQKYEVPWSVVESLSKRYGSGHLLRAWALRRLMYELADLVELSDPAAEDVTKVPVFKSPGADEGHRLYNVVNLHYNPRTTLQTLAIRVYMDLIQEKNADGTIDERSLRRDLRRLEAWENADKTHTRLKKEYAAGAGHHWKARIPIRLYSESFRPLTPAELEESALLDSLREGETEE